MNIRRIAEIAGVSVATISRVLNHPEQVLPETRDRVLAVMNEQNYTPNFFARGLNLGKTNTIALLVPSVESNLYQNIITGIETVARNKGYAVFFCDTHGDEKIELDYLKMADSHRIDGIILVCSHLSEEQVLSLCEKRLPCVHVGKNRTGGWETLCYIDFDEGAYRLMRHMLLLGHKKFQLLLDKMQESETAQICSGVRRALLEHGLPADSFSEEYAENSVRGGYLAAKRIIQQCSVPNALVAFGHEQAFGIIKAAQDEGVEIPEKLALASLTDSPVSAIVSPSLTGLELPATKLGMAAARMLFDRIEETELDLGVPQEMVLQPKLKIRRSCGNEKFIYELFD